MISAVAVLDCTSAVTPRPEMSAAQRLATLCAMTLRRLAPKTRRMPARTSWVPQTSSAIAARRLSRCFITQVNYTPTRGRAALTRPAHPAQFIEDETDGPD